MDESDFLVGNEEKEIEPAGHTFGTFQGRINKYRKYRNSDFRESNKSHIINEDGRPKYSEPREIINE